MYFLDFFAGIGLFRLGLEQAGWTCKGHCEIDKYANMSYQAMHRIKEGEWFEEDITKVSAQSLPDVDLWTGGFPCQDVSMAGKGEDYTENELACFLSLFDSSENEVTINPDGLSLKMLRESFPLAEAGILPLFYVNWPHWGTVWNTRLSIPKTTVYPKAESVCTLSEILQEEVPEKYFLSEVQARQLLHRLLEARREAGSMTQEVFHQLSLLEQED